jgi:hypothetical protein
VWYWKYILRHCLLKHIVAGKDADAGAVAGPQSMRMRALGQPTVGWQFCGRWIWERD